MANDVIGWLVIVGQDIVVLAYKRSWNSPPGLKESEKQLRCSRRKQQLGLHDRLAVTTALNHGLLTRPSSPYEATDHKDSALLRMIPNQPVLMVQGS